MTKTPSVDPAVLDLATSFLQGHPEIDTPEARMALAVEMQRAIEDWISGRLPPLDDEELDEPGERPVP